MALFKWRGCEIRVINNNNSDGPIWKDLRDENSKAQYGNHFV